MKQIIIVMGVCGSGKTAIGKALSERLGLPFFDGDDFHPQENLDKMTNSVPLNDNDRQPWLLKLSKNLKEWQNSTGAILACSALKESYRQVLNTDLRNVFWIVLQGDFDVIIKRMLSRSNHYMKSEMLQSQFDVLEIPNYGFHVSIEKSIEEISNSIIEEIQIHE
ncbi:gluconokinase [Seonamhaeicola marinus]|uniref:Gluconokinase n=1 Tax=Seonamhaeicola marinus TaxID=1912246 RepID=A0A5D0HSV3_9FLAO|nr:gluconokinase [Seonamhaeicola marinus]TYA74386.1 gluconokinase [Seonamhaeicola marinus]